ncbi:MAG: hypothetical protein Kow0092_10850 [Deferrisomatales bacterium]
MNVEQVTEIARALQALSRDLEELERAGAEIPTVVKNAVRLRGTLRALEVQFRDLDELAR